MCIYHRCIGTLPKGRCILAPVLLRRDRRVDDSGIVQLSWVWVCTVYLQKSYLGFNTKSIKGWRRVTTVVVPTGQESPKSRGIDLDLNLEKGTHGSCRSAHHTGGRGARKPPWWWLGHPTPLVSSSRTLGYTARMGEECGNMDHWIFSVVWLPLWN